MLKIIGEDEVREHRNKKNFSGRICCICKSSETGKNFNGDAEHGMIQSKLRQLYYGDWITHIGTEHNFDTLFYICISKDMKNIERIYIIPQTELYGIQTVKIIRNPSSSKILKWDKYKSYGIS